MEANTLFRIRLNIVAMGLVGLIGCGGQGDVGESLSAEEGESFDGFELAWHNGQATCVEYINFREDLGSNYTGRYYLTYPVNPAAPQDPAEGNDCVTRLPGDMNFKAECKTIKVVPGPNANASNVVSGFLPYYNDTFVQQVNLGSGWQYLTSHALIETAEAAGVVAFSWDGWVLKAKAANASECGG
jgi:hypothetical protein